MLGAQAVLDEKRSNTGVAGDSADELAVRCKRAVPVAAAVEVDEDWSVLVHAVRDDPPRGHAARIDALDANLLREPIRLRTRDGLPRSALLERWQLPDREPGATQGAGHHLEAEAPRRPQRAVPKPATIVAKREARRRTTIRNGVMALS